MPVQVLRTWWNLSCWCDRSFGATQRQEGKNKEDKQVKNGRSKRGFHNKESLGLVANYGKIHN